MRAAILRIPCERVLRSGFQGWTASDLRSQCAYSVAHSADLQWLRALLVYLGACEDALPFLDGMREDWESDSYCFRFMSEDWETRMPLRFQGVQMVSFIPYADSDGWATFNACFPASSMSVSLQEPSVSG